MNQLQSKIESILFVTPKPVTAKGLAKILEVEQNEVEQALNELAQQHKEAGIVLLNSGEVWQLATNSENSAIVKNFLNAELREKLTDASVETLAIIAYRQPISKGEIEAIRGVNCQYSIRHLLIRGLIQKTPNPKDSRQILYETTVEFLQHMGLQSTKELPDFEVLVEKIKLPEAPEIGEPTIENTPELPVSEDQNEDQENIQPA
ncbi:MAG: scpB [Candidatus Doudnabacteria bacterium]|nr:scpB [Candidatus Doudnabacteria bacterium]